MLASTLVTNKSHPLTEEARMDRPHMTREQVAKLVVGQEVNIGEESVPYGFKGKVVKVTDDEVEVQFANLTIYRFDKDGKETSDSRRQRIVSGGPPEEFFTGDWHLVPETEPWYIVQDETIQ